MGKLIMFFLLVIFFFSNSKKNKANGLSCAECDSKKVPECIDTPPSVTNCAIHAIYCVTTRVISLDGNVTRIIRGCSEIDLGNECNENRADPKSNKICFSTCWENGCNLSLNTNNQLGSLNLFNFKQTFIFVLVTLTVYNQLYL